MKFPYCKNFIRKTKKNLKKWFVEFNNWRKMKKSNKIKVNIVLNQIYKLNN